MEKRVQQVSDPARSEKFGFVDEADLRKVLWAHQSLLLIAHTAASSSEDADPSAQLQEWMDRIHNHLKADEELAVSEEIGEEAWP